MTALAVLPLIALFLLFGAIHAWRRGLQPLADWRESVFIAMVCIGVWVAAGTELLGLFHSLTFWPVVVFWIVPVIAAAANLMRCTRKITRLRMPPLTWLSGVSIALICLVLLAALITALIAPPNNMDSLDYHLPRIVAWMQQRSLADYPTNYVMQLAMPGLMEYLGLNSMILGHGSAWAVNVFGWISLVILALAGSSMTQQLGGKRESQILAALFIVTIPMAFGMASTFKPELMEAMWIEILACWLLKIFITRQCSGLRLALIAITFGLAALTHGTGYVYGLPLAGMAAIGLWRCGRWKSLMQLAAIALTVLVINAGYYARNLTQFGGIFGPPAGDRISLQVTNTCLSPAITAENILRDTASMVAGPSHVINQALGTAIERIARSFHLNMQDPRATQGVPGIAKPYDGVAYFPNNEYRVSWPFQCFLILLFPLAIWQTARHAQFLRCWAYVLLPAGCFLVMAAVVRWQQQINHLLIPIPALLMPAAAVAISGRNFRWFRPLAAITSVAALLPFAFLYPRALVGQQAIECHSQIDLLVRQHSVNARTLKRMVAFMRRYQGGKITIGIMGRPNLPPFALEEAMMAALHPMPTFIYVNTTIHIAGYRQPSPNVIFANADSHRPVVINHATGRRYQRIASFDSMAIYAPLRRIR
jgi:hypothetical protein